MARSGVRPQFARRSSDAWSTPKKSKGDAAPDAAPPPPTIADVPIEVNDSMPPNVIEFHDRDGETVGAITNIGEPPPLDLRAIGDAELLQSSLGGARTTAPMALQLATVTATEIDHLWDWARSDRDGVFNFMGFIPPHSIELFKWIENFQQLEREGRSLFQSVYMAGRLVGFVMLFPLQQTPKGLVGDCHIYLSKDVRGDLPTMLPLLMAEADRMFPNVSLRVVQARDNEWVRLLCRVGFTTTIVLTRPAAASTGVASGS